MSNLQKVDFKIFDMGSNFDAINGSLSFKKDGNLDSLFFSFSGSYPFFYRQGQLGLKNEELELLFEEEFKCVRHLQNEIIEMVDDFNSDVQMAYKAYDVLDDLKSGKTFVVSHDEVEKELNWGEL